MASTPVTAPSPDSPSPPAPPPPSMSPPPESDSESSPPPPPTPVEEPPQKKTPETPPPTTPSPPPPSSSPPPQSASSPPPSDDNSNSPPPSDNDSNSTSPPPPSNNDDDSPSPPPPKSSSSSPPPPDSSDSPVTPPPPPVAFSNPPPSRSVHALSPPPPTSKHSPPSHKSTTSSTTSSSDLSVPVIIGIAAGIGALVIILAVVMFCCCCKKKKKRPTGYYGDSHGGHRGDYYNGGQHQHGWNTGPPPPMDHVVKMGGPMTGPPSSGQWPPALPPPPPPMMSSGDMSSQYSGQRTNPLPPPSPSIALGFNKSTFSYQELASATNGFSQANLLGQGGFGYVHKGVLPNGKEVAVKSLKSGSGQGEREFQAEVEIISRVHHRHLVSLVGYCIAGEQRMLVYEFVPNGTLEYHLYGSGRPTMDWPSRLKIALGSAKGLAYLHEDCHPRIIHRDIKAANILLDYKFEAMVADFGLAKLSSDNYTHVSTRVMGTFGYLAPEYASSGKLTEKSDVFSFGVMLLELLTGRRPVDTTNTYMDDSLVDWARPLLTKGLVDGNYDELVDPRLENNYNHNEMTRLAACASASVRHSARRRPKMSQIVRALEGDSSLEDLNDGVRPGSLLGSSSGGSDQESYNAEMKRVRRVATATASEEFGGSSEYGPTSEYGMNPSSSSSEGPHSREMEPRR